MDNFNKIISFVLGLIVVVVILLMVTGRLKIFNSKSGIFSISKGNTTASPTPTKVAESVTPSVTDEPDANASVTPRQSPSPTRTQAIKTIPNTGASTDILIASFILMGVGFLFKKATA